MIRFFRYTEPSTGKVLQIDVDKALSEEYVGKLSEEWRLCLEDVKEILDDAEKEHPDMDMVYVENDMGDPERKTYIWNGFKLKTDLSIDDGVEIREPEKK